MKGEVLHYDDDAGTFKKSVAAFEHQLTKYNVKAKGHVAKLRRDLGLD